MTETRPSSIRIVSAQADAWQEHSRFPGIWVNRLLNSADNPYASVAQVRVPAGVTIGRHFHAGQVETIFVLAGRAVLTLAGVEHAFEAGQIVAVPAELEHSLHNPGPAEVELLAFFTPPLS